MATEVLNKPGGTEDDEEWLYGGTSNVENKEPESLRAVLVGEVPAQTGGESGGLSSADQSQEKFPDDDDDSDDEDDVQVTIGDIKAFPVSDAGNRMFKGPAYQKGQAGQKPGATGPGVKGVDPDAEGIVNGVSVFEFNLDTLKDEEKPWRKPGADITDYFNYGFNEDSWKQYCSKQNRLRAENGLSVPKFPSSNQPTFIRVPSTNPVVSSGAPPVRFIPHQPHYIQPVTNAGAIAVIGSTAASRRPADEEIQTIGTIGTETINTEIDIKPDIGLPPPHGMPPVDMPPPDYSVPPPGMPPVFPNIPPPGMNVPPPMFNPPPVSAYYPPPHGAPPHVPPPDPRFPDQPPFGFEPPSQNPGYADPKAPWDSRERDSYRDKYDYGKKRDKSPGSGYSSEGSDDYRYSRSSDRRDYYDRDYSRSRDGRRSRSRSRSRSRDRRHRERDDKHKSKSRKIKTEPDDSDYYKSSKHKKSKKSKRDKGEDDYSPSRPSRDEDVPSVPS